MLQLRKTPYSELSSKAKESYNFQKISAALADYGFFTNWLNVDFESADFIATHFNGLDIIKVQLKGRLTIDKKYMGKEIHMAFPYNNSYFMVPHDYLVELVGSCTPWLESSSWVDKGGYSSQSPSKDLLEKIKEYKL